MGCPIRCGSWRKNPVAGIAGEWFTGHGRAENLGWFGKEENREIAAKLREVFAEWIDNGHSDFSDPNTCILRIRLTDGVLFSHGNGMTCGMTERLYCRNIR